MFEGFGWKKRTGEKREYVNPETREPVAKLVVDNGEVIGAAKGPEEEVKLHLEHENEVREAA